MEPKMDEEAKIKHSKRIHQKEVKVEKEIKLAKEFGIEVKEPHKLHKRHLFNCGNPNCFMCMNPRKSIGEKTIQEKKFDQKKLHEEGVEE
jgi:hypothetical protein